MFHSITGNVNNKNINLSQYSNNGIFDVTNFIVNRGVEHRQSINGLYEMKYLAGIDLLDLQKQILQYSSIHGGLSGFKYNGLVVRGDLRECVYNGIFNIFN